MPDPFEPTYELLKPGREQSSPEPAAETPEEKRKRKHREYQKRYKERHPEKIARARREPANLEKRREQRRRWRKANPEKVREAKRRWRDANPEKVREHKRRWCKANPDKLREKDRRYERAHPEKIREIWRRCGQRKRSLKTAMQSPDQVYHQVLSVLPPGLPRHVRDDVAGSLCLAIYDKKILVKDIKAEVGSFLKAYNREYDTFQTLSLDVLIPGTKTTYLDALAAE